MTRPFRVGQIVPSSNVTMETEIPAMLRARETVLPDRFTFHSARMRMKKVTKEELNRQRFFYPLQAVGVEDEALAERFSEDFFAIIPTKSGLMPHAKEVLEYLAPQYNLYILSNGFQELQCHKMRSAGIDRFFKKIVLSDDIGVLKPWPEIFHFALSATQSEVRDSLMIGDSWENDVAGAKGVGMHQVFYNVTGKEELPFQPTYHISNLKELMQIL